MQKSQPAKKFARKYARYLMDQRIIVRTGTQTLHGRTKNLAEGGMAATVAGEMALGEKVELQFQLPESSDPLVVQAEIRYRQGFQYGFKFLPLPDIKVGRIRNTLDKLQPDHD